MAFPTNFAGNSMFRALLWSLALHGVLLLSSVALIALPGAVSSKGALRARLVGTSNEARPMPILEGTNEREPVVRRAPAASAAVGNRSSAGAPTAPSSLAEEAGTDAEGLRAYRLALAVRAKPYWQYPVEAQKARWSGTVQVRVALLPGAGVTVSLEQSSGHESLDVAALEMLRAAVRTASIPESLRDQRFSFVMPVVFEAPAGGAELSG